MNVPESARPLGATDAGDTAVNPAVLPEDLTRRSLRTTGRENVGRGLAAASFAIVLGASAAVALWKVHFVASISSALIGILAVRLYEKGAGQQPKKGLYPLVGLIVAGVVVSFFAVIAADLVEAYNSAGQPPIGYSSALDFAARNITEPSVLSTYQNDAVMFALFGLLGTRRTITRLIALGRSHRHGA
ncbi:hypothetical protein [Calidifontibacter terrae]